MRQDIPILFIGGVIVSEPPHIHLIESKKRGYPHQHRSSQPYPPHIPLPYPPQLPQQHPQRQESHRTEAEGVGRHLRGRHRKETIHQQHEREHRDTMAPLAATHQQQRKSRHHEQQMHHPLDSEAGRFARDIIFIVAIPNITVWYRGQVEGLCLLMIFQFKVEVLFIQLFFTLIVRRESMAGIDLPRQENCQRDSSSRRHLSHFPLSEPETVFRHGIDAPRGIHEQAHQPFGEHGAAREQGKHPYPSPFPSTMQVLHPRPQGGGNIKDETDIVVVHSPMSRHQIQQHEGESSRQSRKVTQPAVHQQRTDAIQKRDHQGSHDDGRQAKSEQ